jgi:hypothetical protein
VHQFLQPLAFFQKQKLKFLWPATRWFWTEKFLSLQDTVPRIQESSNRKNVYFEALLSRSYSIIWNRLRKLRHQQRFKIVEAVSFWPFSVPSCWFLLRKLNTISLVVELWKKNRKERKEYLFQKSNYFNVFITLEIDWYFWDESFSKFSLRE